MAGGCKIRICSVNAGGMGFITPRSFSDERAYRAELVKCWEYTDGILLGSWMTVASEIWAQTSYKKRVVEYVSSDTRILL